jgi:predicted HTH transcriptional regulator
MIKMCRDAGLPDPEWSQDSGGITVMLRKPGRLFALNERQEALLRDMDSEDTISTSVFRDRFSISDRQARNDLTELAKTVGMGTPFASLHLGACPQSYQPKGTTLRIGW